MDDWPTIVARHRSRVWQTAYRLLGNHADASDCFQETFLAALQVSRREAVRDWAALLARLAARRALDRLRSRMRRAVRYGAPADWQSVASPEAGPVEEAEASELAVRLRQALAQLPAEQAEMFCLRWLDGMSYRQIGRALGLKTSAVGVLLHRGRVRLREMLNHSVTSVEREVLR